MSKLGRLKKLSMDLNAYGKKEQSHILAVEGINARAS
jgi:hypothetical protein